MALKWQYEDSTGVIREGTFQSAHDFGGTDVPYMFKRDDGTIDIVSGSRLKKARPIYPKTTEEKTDER